MSASVTQHHEEHQKKYSHQSPFQVRSCGMTGQPIISHLAHGANLRACSYRFAGEQYCRSEYVMDINPGNRISAEMELVKNTAPGQVDRRQGVFRSAEPQQAVSMVVTI